MTAHTPPSRSTGPADPAAPRVAALAGLLADETRATVCLALMDMRAWTGGELARLCGVAPSTMSEHLTRLVDGGLLVRERQGRHHYVRIADPDTARFVEDLVVRVATDVRRPAAGGLRDHSAGRALARGRTCYDHLAGRLGVAITDAMTARGLLRQDTGFALTDDGLRWLTELGADLTRPASSRRPLARPCLDWTERRQHLAGVAGAEICRLVLGRDWAARIGTTRAVKVTPLGEQELRRTLAIPAEALALPS